MLRVLLVALAVASTTAYWNYTVDCMDECQRRKLPCTISMLSPEFFPCDCIITEDSCILGASSTVACLVLSGKSFGGEASWIPYWNYTHPSTSTPSPSPTPVPGDHTNFLQIYAAVVTTLLFIYGGSGLLRCVFQTWRTRQYRLMREQQATSGGVPVSPDSPYAERSESA